MTSQSKIHSLGGIKPHTMTKRTLTLRLIFLVFIGQISLGLYAQLPPPILYIYDASGSMWGQIDGQVKHNIASEVLTNSLADLEDGQAVALMAYGHRREADCSDIEMLLPLSNTSKQAIKEQLDVIKPLGRTPLAASMKMAIEAVKTSKAPAIIILITDGLEVCEGKLCQVVKEALAEGLEIKVHIVGFGIQEENKEELICAAKSAGGQYLDAPSAKALAEALDYVGSHQVSDPAPNIATMASKNNEWIDASVYAYLKGQEEPVTGVRTYQDTGFMYLPDGVYDLTFQAVDERNLPQQTIQNIEVKDGSMASVTAYFDAGKFSIQSNNNGEGWDAIARVYPIGGSKAIAQKRTYGREAIIEVLPGNYELQVEGLKIKGAAIYKEQIEVSRQAISQTSVDFESGTFKVEVRVEEELVDATVRIYNELDKEIASIRTYAKDLSKAKTLFLIPGNYVLRAKTLGKNKGHSKETNFQISAKGDHTESIRF